MRQFGEILAIVRKSRDLTQAELAEALGLSQVAINRYESGDRFPDTDKLQALARALGVTPELLTHGAQFRGALAVDAHMRRQKTTKTSVWRRTEAQLNLMRVSTSLVLSKLSLEPEQHVPTFDSEFMRPDDCARMVRAQWRMPIGPVNNITRWMESAGCLIFERDFGTHRVDGLSQWVSENPVLLVNSNSPTDRKRWTLAHELGHLCLHANGPTEDMEAEANSFAAEFLMPEAAIRTSLRNLDLGTLSELKREWGVSMQALTERAYTLNLMQRERRSAIYKSMNAKGWKAREPYSDLLPREVPQLAAAIGAAFRDRGGLSNAEVAKIAGFVNETENPFASVETGLRLVSSK